MAPERASGINGNQLKNMPNIITSIPTAPSPFPTSNVQTATATATAMSNPPPLPPRQPLQNYSAFQTNSYGGYGIGYGNQYRGFNGYGGYGGYGGYASYAPYSTYNNYGGFSGHSGDAENRFFQYFEESTRPTFRLIETVLHTFSSMTMLLESTYFALTNSFRAVLSVAESVGRLCSTVHQLFSTFALLRFLKWLYRKLTRSTGLQNQDSTNDELWDKSLAKFANENVHNSSFWSGFLLFSIFVVVPYMIHKIANNMKNIEIKGNDPKEWHETDEPAYIATVLYDFVATNSDELSVKAGQKVCLAPKSLQPKYVPGWCKATDNVNVGLLPYNYVKVIGQLKKVRRSTETTSFNDQISSTGTAAENSTSTPTITTDNERFDNLKGK